MSGYDQPMAAASGESEYVGNPESPSTHKKASLLGKLRDKTKKAGSRIKSRVGRKKNADGTDTPLVDGEEHEEEEEHTSDDSPSPASPASSPATTAPRELGSAFQSEPSRYGSGNGAAKEAAATEAVPDMSGLSLDDDSPAAKDEASEPSVTDQRASVGSKDGVYGDDGAGATAGALGVYGLGAASKEPESEEKPSVTEKEPELASEGVGAKTEEIGGYDADDKGDEVAEQRKVTFSSDEPAISTDTAESKAMETEEAAADQSMASDVAKDGVESKDVEDVNDATDGSETYTEKANNAAVDAKDTVGDTMGMSEQSPEGPSMVEKAKEALGVAKTSEGPAVEDQAKETVGSAVDTTKDQTARIGDEASAATEAAKESTGSALDTTKDHTAQAKETVGSAVDTTKDQTARTGDDASAATEAAKESTGSALDTTEDHTAQAKETVVDAATPKQEDKALGEKITEALGAVPAKASETAASVTETAKSPTTTTPGTLTHAPAAHSSDPASPGIMGMIGGLFGFGAKAPEDHSHSHDAPH